MFEEEIEKYLKEVDEELGLAHAKGEICLYGGAVMCLVYKARPSTKDVDAIFEPTQVMRNIARKVAQKYSLHEGWLNDAVKGFVVKHPKKILFDWPNLKVFSADPEYMLAMKSLASRVDTTDKDDIIFLIKELRLRSPEEVFDIIEKYYPKRQIKPVTKFFLEELFEDEHHFRNKD